jgi:hypothetical protein
LSVVFERLTDFENASDMERFLLIYEDNFPPYDRKPFTLFRDLQARLRIYITREDEVFVGFAVTLLLATCPVAYMSYLAVDRRAGTGPRR